MRKSTYFIIVIMTLSFLVGCANDADHTAPPTVSETAPAFAMDTHLTITANTDENAESYTYEKDSSGFSLSFNRLSDVMYHSKSGTIPLDQALSNNIVDVEELYSCILMDARENICKESFESTNGLSTFVYRYTDFDIRVVNDVYETPDGKQHLIRTISFHSPGSLNHAVTFYWDYESKYGYMLDREDWGLTFNVSETTPESITISCTHSGGQQIGQLQTEFYSLYDREGNFIIGVNGQTGGLCDPLNIQLDGESELVINWTNSHDQLPTGDYTLCLEIQDIYDETDVSALTRNFHDRQPYHIDFTVE